MIIVTNALLGAIAGFLYLILGELREIRHGLEELRGDRAAEDEGDE